MSWKNSPKRSYKEYTSITGGVAKKKPINDSTQETIIKNHIN
jgi:hypothetical protein